MLDYQSIIHKKIPLPDPSSSYQSPQMASTCTRGCFLVTAILYDHTHFTFDASSNVSYRFIPHDATVTEPCESLTLLTYLFITVAGSLLANARENAVQP